MRLGLDENQLRAAMIIETKFCIYVTLKVLENVCGVSADKEPREYLFLKIPKSAL